MKRTVLVGLMMALALGVAVYVWVARSFDGIVAGTVEQVGSELLGSSVSVERARVRLRDGRVSLSGIAVANPEGPELGFSTEPALELGEVAVELDLEALDLAAVRAGEAPLPVALVRIEGSIVRAEATRGGLNLERLRQHVRDAVPSQEAQPQSTAGAPIRIRIARLELSGGQLRADSTALGGDVEQVAIPDFAIEDLGGERGATPGEIGKRTCDVLLGRAIRAAALGGASGELERLKAKAREGLRGVFD